MNAQARRATNQYEAARYEMVELLRRKGISDKAVLEAMMAVPRHLFVQDVFRHKSYEDSALPISCHQTISQPYTVAFMTQQLQIQKGNKVLEVGTGSGYQACILSKLGARVFTIERHFELLESARRMFDVLNVNVASKVGDGTVGWSEFSPFDRIIVTAGAPEIPPSLLRQLADGGRMVIPVGDEATQDMVLVTRSGEKISTFHIHGFKFVPLIGKEGWGK